MNSYSRHPSALSRLPRTLRRAVLRAAAAAMLAPLTAAVAFPQAGTAPGIVPGITAIQPAPSSTAPPNPAQPPATLQNTIPAPAMLYPGDDFQLGSGDLISVRLFGSSEYVSTTRIDSNGNVELPYIGSIHIAGLNVHQAQVMVQDRLRTGGFYLNPEIIVQVLESTNSSVTIAGEIRAIVPITGARRLIDVLAGAGGLPSSASHVIRVVRPGTAEPIVVNLGTDLTNTAATSMLIYPRDIIQISRAGVVFILGAFRSQGQLPLDQSMPLTLMQAAALSGGVNYEGKYKDLRLIRTYGTERKLVEVDIKKVLNGQAPDPILQANDIVFLPTNNMKAALKSLGVAGVIGLVLLLLSFGNLT